MKSNVNGHLDQFTNMDDNWIDLNSKKPEPGRLVRLKITSGEKQSVLVAFADILGHVYGFNFRVGKFLPLQMIVEELSIKKGETWDLNTAQYTFLSDGMVNALPAANTVIAQMEDILNNKEDSSNAC